jgi:hypothetical protein
VYEKEEKEGVTFRKDGGKMPRSNFAFCNFSLEPKAANVLLENAARGC